MRSAPVVAMDYLAGHRFNRFFPVYYSLMTDCKEFKFLLT